MYLTLQDLTARFGADETTQRLDHNSDGVADIAVFERIAMDATAEIDFYIGQRYTLPLDNPPEIIKSMAADITRKLYFEPHPPDHVLNAYAQAIRKLEQIASGKFNLTGLALSTAPQSQEARVRFGQAKISKTSHAYRAFSGLPE